ncbi:MAG: beta-lactamase family protein [Planctomycetes bacterium]|nr:beta-lactamase family protein [Planctomycetota bacterium]MCP4772395.1 beta-lactamase family protein [Planctomycetota bacterium]MCP4861505.1 beta-lactamase family protein [Planctomycetota bacterium]
MHWLLRILLATLLLPTASIAVQEAQEVGTTQTTQEAPSKIGILIDELPGDQAEKIWEWTQKLIDSGQIAGASAQIVRKGKVVYRGVHGELELGSGKPVEGDSLFRIYSMTKAVASAACMQLVEQGKLELDDPIHQYLPEWKDVTVLTRDEDRSWIEVPAETPITVRHLLRHTSGLTSALMDKGEIAKRYRLEQRRGGVKSLEELSQRLATLPLKHHPGMGWTYGQSTNVLGRLVEVVAEQPFDDYLKEHIFDPLGMVDTSFRVSDEDLPRLAAVHQINDEDKVSGVAPGYLASYREAHPVPMGASGLISTLEDYGRFQSMLLGKGLFGEVRLLKKETVALMLDPNEGREQVPFARFGLGFMLKGDRKAPLKVRYASWSGIARTYFINDHQTETGSLLFTQTMPFSFRPGSDFAIMLENVLVMEEATD